MSSLIDWLVNIAVTLYTYISTDITNDVVIVYMAYAFSLVAILILIAFCLSLVPLLFKSITALFKRSSQ